MSAIAAAEAAPDAAPKKGGKAKKLILFVALPLLLIGGGVGGGMYFGRSAGGAEDKHDPNKPKLVPRDGVDAPEHAKGRPDPKLYKATYVPIEATFTSNLRGSDSFVQMGLGISTFYDEKFVEVVKSSEMPIRSAVLMVLSDQDPDAITTPEGKERLKAKLREAINKTLMAKEGFDGVDDVFFTSMVVQ